MQILVKYTYQYKFLKLRHDMKMSIFSHEIFRTPILSHTLYGIDKTHKYLILYAKKYMIYSVQAHRLLRMRRNLNVI